jgi:aquaporin Z
MNSNARVLGAEAMATAVFMIGGLGAAVLGGAAANSPLGIAIAWGISLIAVSHAIGHISGCHVNPAVTLAMVITRKITAARAVFYLFGQIIGALLGGLVVWGIANGVEGWSARHSFAANGWGRWSPGGFGLGSVMMIEIVLTAIWVFVVLCTSGRAFSPGARGLSAGIVVMMISLVSTTVDGASANPVRSLASAVFAGGDALKQLWGFIVFPLIGAIVGVVAWLAVDSATLEDTMLDSQVTRQIRDVADAVGDRAVGMVEGAVDSTDTPNS